VQTVGAREHRELWVPAADLLQFNLSILGKIAVVDAYTGPRFSGTIDAASKLPVPPSPSAKLEVVYRLRDDLQKIASIQEATRTTDKFGIEPTHGLLGSPEWWTKIETGDLPLLTLRGTISRIYMASMNDWPEFEVQTESGELSCWTREANTAELERVYAPGRAVEIDYVLQRPRATSFDAGSETKVVIAIRVAAEPAVAPDRG
jgi:hypothetical protein